MTLGQASLYEAEVLAAVLRGIHAARAISTALDSAAQVIRRGDVAGGADLEKVIALHQLALTRLEVFHRRLTEGQLSDGRAEVTP